MSLQFLPKSILPQLGASFSFLRDHAALLLPTILRRGQTEQRSAASRSSTATIQQKVSKLVTRSLVFIILSMYVIFPVSVTLIMFRQPEIASWLQLNHSKTIAMTCLLLTLLLTWKYHWRGLIPCLAFCVGLLKYSMDSYHLWTPPAALDLSGKVAVVTGANTGLGLSTAKALAGMGAHVVMTCRSLERCQSAVKLVQEAGRARGGSGQSAVLNLASLESAYNLTLQLTDQYPSINYLFNNAGSTPLYNLTQEGLEDGFGGMHLAHVAVTLGLLPSLRNAGIESGIPSRVVMVSSEMAISSACGIFGSEPFRPDFMQGTGEGDLRGEQTRAGTALSDLQAYGRAKLCNILFALELNRRLAVRKWPVVAHALHPGGVLTTSSARGVASMFAGIPGLPLLLSRLYVPMLWRSPEAGARTLLFSALATDSEPVVQGGQYFDAMCRPFLSKEQQENNELDEEDLKVTLKLWGNRTWTIFKDPSEALRAADIKWATRLWDVSLLLLEDSPARKVVVHAP